MSYEEIRINLGYGIVKVQGLTEIHKIMGTIAEFGIDMDMLDALDFNYDQLHEVYNNINCYRSSVRELKRLKNEMAEKNHEV